MTTSILDICKERFIGKEITITNSYYSSKIGQLIADICTDVAVDDGPDDGEWIQIKLGDKWYSVGLETAIEVKI